MCIRDRAITLLIYFWLQHNLNLNGNLINDFFFFTILGVIIGGRIGYILLYNPNYYFYNPLEIFKVWKGGMAFHGGLIGVILSTLVFSLKNKISFLEQCEIWLSRKN